MEPIRAKAGDAIRIEKQLTTGDERTNNPADLTGETVRVYIQFGEETLVANQEVEYVDRASGKVAVELSPSQTSNIGRHNIEWVVDPQGDPTTFPDSDYDILRTVSPLDRELTPSEETPPDLTVTNLTVNDTATVGTLDAGSVNAEQVRFAQNNTGFSGRVGDRPIVSEQARTINVGTDVSSIQEAVNEIPLLLRHRYKINVESGTYSEDLLIPPFMVADTSGEDSAGNVEGATHNPRITGDTATPSNVEVSSITTTGVQGAIAPLIEGFNVTGDTPYDDESTGIQLFGCQNVSLRAISWAGSSASRGVYAYGSTVTVRNCDFGSTDLDYGVASKHNSSIHVDSFGSNPTTGTVNSHVFRVDDASVLSAKAVGATGNSGYVENANGLAHNADWNAFEPVVGLRYNISSNQTVSTKDTGGVQTVQFDDEGYDRHGRWDTSNYKLSIPVDGVYRIEASLHWDSPSAGTEWRVIINEPTGRGIISRSRGLFDGNAFETTYVADTHKMNAGQEIEIQTRHDEGSDLTINQYEPSTYVTVRREN